MRYLIRRRKNRILGVIAFLAVAILAIPALAGNPFVLSSGKALQWPSSEIAYHMDPGDLGPYPGSLVQQLIMLAFRNWTDVPHSSLKIIYGGLLPENITEDNYLKFSGKYYNPVIFDSDGAIIDALKGEGASDSILGLSSPAHNNGSGTIVNSEIILNGKYLLGKGGDINRLFSTMLHEIGHFLGLDHSQLHPEFAFDNDPANNIFLPVMFPIETDDRISPTNLSQDDRMTIQILFPGADFHTSLGSIRGTVTRPANEAVQGANVVAEEIDSPYLNSYAVVSDLSIDWTGEFAFYVPPGRYILYIESINPRFTGSSRVGPFSDDRFSPSFVKPVLREYYNGTRENGYVNLDDPEDKEIITVRAGNSVEGIEFVSNEETLSVSDWSLF
ncbi:MAG: hypothetical protein AB1656_26315 [Candidatus Omnitrophota bacterium]